jgi:formylglycine-generating enzyme required for sulfatase activity
LNFIEYFPDGKTLVSSGEHGLVTLWNAVTGKSLREWQFPGVYASIAPDGRHLATANGNGTVYILRIAEGPPRALSAEEAKKQQVDEARRLGVPVQITNSIGMKLNLIPPGRFLMGSPENEPGRQANEGPQHEVTIAAPFHMGIHEVTFGQFKAFIDATKYQTEAEQPGKGANWLDLEAKQFVLNDPKMTWRTPGWPQTDEHPVVCVSWNDAADFCGWLSKKEGKTYRLPTEAEWEYACRAGTQTAFHFGETLTLRQANYNGSTDRWHTDPSFTRGKSVEKPVGVGSYPPNGFGLHDMHGNVWERSADRNRVGLGGAWEANALGCRSAGRNPVPADWSDRWNNGGFRVVCDYRPPQITNSIGMKLARIPPGKFLMGSPENEPGRQANEGPQHEVKITRPFHIGVHEVTQEQYEKLMGKNPSRYRKGEGGGPRHPVETITWEDAVAFCRKLSERPEEKNAQRHYRLPSEAEWEYACRAGTRTVFSFGDDSERLDRYAWLRAPFPQPHHPVGTLQPNAWGLYDMHGNVWEWCADYYGAQYYGESPSLDPRGPDKGSARVIRGGGMGWNADQYRCANRFPDYPPSAAALNVGFRVVCDVRTAKDDGQ